MKKLGEEPALVPFGPQKLKLPENDPLTQIFFAVPESKV
jgi:hypothetical protein